MRTALVVVSLLLIAIAGPSTIGCCEEDPSFFVEYEGVLLPCYAYLRSDLPPTKVMVHLPLTEITTDTPCYVQHGWGTLCWESFAGMDSLQIALFVVAKARFSLEVDGQVIAPSYLVVASTDCSGWSPRFCCGGSSGGDWGWNIGWGFTFPGGFFAPGVHSIAGTWAWNGGSVRCGPSPETILPTSQTLMTTLSVLP